MSMVIHMFGASILSSIQCLSMLQSTAAHLSQGDCMGERHLRLQRALLILRRAQHTGAGAVAHCRCHQGAEATCGAQPRCIARITFKLIDQLDGPLTRRMRCCHWAKRGTQRSPCWGRMWMPTGEICQALHRMVRSCSSITGPQFQLALFASDLVATYVEELSRILHGQGGCTCHGRGAYTEQIA